MKAMLARGALWTIALGSAVLFIGLGLKRLTYPLELDCIEGVMMDHVVRLARGQSIYVEPSLSFIPLAYMPLFAAASSVIARAFGPHLWEPRLISFLSVLGIAGMTVAIVRAETRSWTLGAGGAALYLAAFGITGGCYDVARPDSLMLCLAVAGLMALRFSRGIAGALSAGLLLSLAFLAKQHAAWFVLAALLHLAVNDRRRVLPFAVAAGIGCAGAYALLSLWLGPWFRFFTLEIPSGWSELSRGRIFRYGVHGLLGTLAPLSVPALLSLGLPSRPWRGRDGLWMWAGLGAIGTGLMATLDPSAYRHVLTPTVVVLAALGPISLHRVMTALAPRASSAAAGPPALACVVLALQFVPLAYPVRSQMPRPRAREAWTRFVADLRAEPGPVLLPYHGFYCASAGKSTSLHMVALDDILRSHGNRLLAHDPRFLDRLFAPLMQGPGRPVIITDVPLSQSGRLWAALEPAYRPTGDLGWLSEPLRPVTGNRFTPSLRYEPREPAGAGSHGAPAPRRGVPAAPGP